MGSNPWMLEIARCRVCGDHLHNAWTLGSQVSTSSVATGIVSNMFPPGRRTRVSSVIHCKNTLGMLCSRELTETTASTEQSGSGMEFSGVWT